MLSPIKTVNVAIMRTLVTTLKLLLLSPASCTYKGTVSPQKHFSMCNKLEG